MTSGTLRRLRFRTLSRFLLKTPYGKQEKTRIRTLPRTKPRQGISPKNTRKPLKHMHKSPCRMFSRPRTATRLESFHPAPCATLYTPFQPTFHTMPPPCVPHRIPHIPHTRKNTQPSPSPSIKNSARTDTSQCRHKRHNQCPARSSTLNQSAYEQERAPTNPTTHTIPHYSTDRTRIASSDQCTYPNRHSTQSPPP